MLMKIKNDYKVPIYSLDLKDERDRARAWLTRLGNPYVALRRYLRYVSDALQVYGTPMTLVDDKHGRIRYRYSGSIDQSSWNDTLWPLIKQLQMKSNLQ